MQSNVETCEQPTTEALSTEELDNTPRVRYTLSEGLERSALFRGNLEFSAELPLGKGDTREEIEEEIAAQMKEWLFERDYIGDDEL